MFCDFSGFKFITNFKKLEIKMLSLMTFLQETEEFLSNLVVNKTVSAKIDRLDGIIHFQRAKVGSVHTVLWQSDFVL